MLIFCLLLQLFPHAQQIENKIVAENNFNLDSLDIGEYYKIMSINERYLVLSSNNENSLIAVLDWKNGIILSQGIQVNKKIKDKKLRPIEGVISRENSSLINDTLYSIVNNVLHKIVIYPELDHVGSLSIKGEYKLRPKETIYRTIGNDIISSLFIYNNGDSYTEEYVHKKRRFFKVNFIKPTIKNDFKKYERDFTSIGLSEINEVNHLYIKVFSYYDQIQILDLNTNKYRTIRTDPNYELDNRLEKWDKKSAFQPIISSISTANYMLAVAYPSKDLFTPSNETIIRLFDYYGRELSSLLVDGNIRWILLSEDGKRLVTLSNKSNLSVYTIGSLE